MNIYLDNAATTPLDKEVLDAMIPYMTENFGNPSSIHAHGRKVRSAIEDARKIVATHLNASAGEIFFTSSATEANNMALQGAVDDLEVTRIISSRMEHHCILHTLEYLEDNKGVKIEYLNLDPKGNIDTAQLIRLLEDKSEPTLVTLMHANNEIGTMIDLNKVGEICKEHDVLFHSDTVQTIGKFKIDLQDTPISFLSGSAHKFYGPKGVGFLYMNGDNKVKPRLFGGGQERNMRAGTENAYGIVGLGKALDLAYNNLDTRKADILKLRERFKRGLYGAINDLQYLGNQEELSNYAVVNVSLPRTTKTEMIAFNLDIAGISASTGSACSSGAVHDSHVLEAINADPNRKSVRFSFSHHNTVADIDKAIEVVAKIVSTS